MFRKIAEILSIPELRRKILVTLGLLVVYRMGAFISLPGVDTAAVQELLQQGGAEGGIAAILRVASALTGGALAQATLFALGIIGEYLARMHFRMMERPPYAVAERTFSPPES